MTDSLRIPMAMKAVTMSNYAYFFFKPFCNTKTACSYNTGKALYISNNKDKLRI